MLKKLDFSFSDLNKLKLFSINIISGIDSLYFPTWEKIVKVIGHKNFVFIADCKAGSIATRANIAANQGFYCVPLPMSGQNPQFLKQWVLEPPPESVDIRLPRQEEQETAIAKGFEVELGKFWLNPETNKWLHWHEWGAVRFC